MAAPFFLFLGLILFLHREYLFLPYYWDEILVYYTPLHQLLGSGLSALRNPENFFYHPPGMQLLAWPAYLAFGDAPLTGRVFIAVGTAAGLHFLVLLGRRFLGWSFGYCLAFALFLSPSFFPSATQFHADMVFFALAMPYFYFGVTGRFTTAAIIGFVSGAVRESSIAFGIGLAVFYYLNRSPAQQKKAQVLAIAAPFASVIINFAWQKIASGSFFNHISFQDNDIGFPLSQWPANFWITTGHFLPVYFIPYGLGEGILLLLCTAALFLQKKFKWRLFAPEFSRVLIASVATASCFILFFSLHTAALVRYYFAAFPLMLLLLVGFFWRFLGRYTLLILLTSALIHPKYYYSVNGIHDLGRVENLTYKDSIEVALAMGKFFDENVPAGSRIRSTWPFDVMFTSPIFGYVTHRMRREGWGPENEFDFLILGFPGIPPNSEQQRFLTEDLHKLKKVKEVRDRHLWIELYQNPGVTGRLAE